jgi:Tfp pilus assembly protein PilZ
MRGKKQHKKSRLNIAELDGKMFLTDNVEILTISFGGVSLKTERALAIGKEYLITLIDRGRWITVKGIVVRSASGGTEERRNGERAALYTAGMRFEDGQRDEIAAFLNVIGQNKIPEARVAVERRRAARFHVTFPLDTMLSHSAQFKVKKISLSGMLVQSDQALEIHSIIPMGLSLDADDQVNFNGRVASCRMTGDRRQAHCEIEVEFSGLTDTDRALLKTFIDSLAVMKGNAEGEKADK